MTADTALALFAFVSLASIIPSGARVAPCNSEHGDRRAHGWDTRATTAGDTVDGRRAAVSNRG